ncbi:MULTISPECIES: hypothetical protein [Haloferax]|uniref:Uncharacterized protein n=2 Tax=Haloferax TaxID=2251 RepID=A0A6G1Z0W8_9EURY|nr:MULTISPECIES: hypothetical protein [Haloferax]KAB1187483.1 hypothetical protein Hfx1149_05335 [Haloferax sp. CBA1149]MRW80135.1 hypothetical protein [Haloferax marinisediminis]
MEPARKPELHEEHNDEAEIGEVADEEATEESEELEVEREVIVTYYDDAMARCGLWGDARWRD